MAETIAPPGATEPQVKEDPAVKKDFHLELPVYLPDMAMPRIRNKKELSPIVKPEDESDPSNANILRPLKRVKVLVEDDKAKVPWGQKRPLIELPLDEGIQEELEYVSKTGGVEVGTERTAILQGVVDRMSRGTTLTTRVAILNKGKVENAFVLPDGSIFVTQALLNRLNSLDEVAGVLAHELGHLIHETGSRAIQAKGFDKTGLRWLHESACDFQAPDLLEKAGFNTTAYATAIDIVGANERGAIHQTGHTRGSQSIGTHFFQERTTSNAPLTPLPPGLHKELIPTNLELGKEYIEQGDISSLERLLPNLHPKDLNSIYTTLVANKDVGVYAHNKKARQNYYPMYQMATGFIADKLTGLGYSESEVRTFLLSQSMSYRYRGRDSFILGNQDMLYKMVADIDGISERLPEMSSRLFGKETRISKIGDYSITHNLLHAMEYLGYYENFEPQNGRIALTEPLLVESLGLLSKVTQPGDPHFVERYEYSRNTQITEVAADYLSRTYIKMATEGGVEIDRDQIRHFFETLKDKGVAIRLYDFEQKLILNLRAGSEGSTQSRLKQNTEAVVEVFKEVYGIKDQSKEKVAFSFQKIDEFIEKQSKLSPNDYLAQREKIDGMGLFFSEMRRYFDENNLSDQNRLEYVEYMGKKLDQAQLACEYSIMDYLGDASVRRPLPVTAEAERQTNTQFKRFNLKLVTAMAAFKEDGDAFYGFVDKAMQGSGIDTSGFTKLEMINLCQSLINNESTLGKIRMIVYGDTNSDVVNLDQGVKIADYKRLMELPFMSELLNKRDQVPSSISEISKWLEEQSKKQNIYSYSGDVEGILYRDNLRSLIVGREVRERANALAAKGIPEEDLGDWFDYIKKYLPASVQKDNLLREINRRFLHSENISLEQKVDYVTEHFNAVGIEGMVVVANQINDMKTYVWFREKMAGRISEYMKGDGFISKMAVADYLTSALTRNYSTVLMTSREDAKAKVEGNTASASIWFQSVFSGLGETMAMLKYDKAKGKFDVGYYFRDQLRSLSDTFTKLKNLSATEKFAVAHKVLFDTNGAFSSDRTKKDLGEQLVKILDIKPGFVASVLKAACVEGDKKFIGFPAARLLSNVMMRGLDISAVDKRKLRKKKVYVYDGETDNLWDRFTDAEIDYILKSSTRDLTIFGPRFQNQEGSMAALLAQESDAKYHELMDRLAVELPPFQEVNSEVRVSRVDPNTEAVIQGVEAMGPLGYRSEQLTGQFKRFGSPIDERLSESFDSNPGMNKLVFWENLYTLSQRKGEVRDFIEQRGLEIGDYIGGGSLQTTYRASYVNEQGDRVPIVLKMNNPNVEMFITQGWNIAKGVLESAAQQGSSKDKGYARMSMKLIDLARDWSMADVNTPTYEADDEAFRTNNISTYNKKTGLEVYAPGRVFTTKELKAEELADGDTINRLLKSTKISGEQKKQIVESAISFFCSQFKAVPIIDVDGQSKVLLHSDPSVGNLMASPENTNRLGIIDRNLYLKIPTEDVAVLEKLMQNGNDNDFVYGFLERVFDRNNMEGMRRTTSRAKIIASVGAEYVKMRARGNVDRLSLLNTMLESIDKVGMELPYDIRLAIRNIGAMDELGKRYGVDIKQIYQAA